MLTCIKNNFKCPFAFPDYVNSLFSIAAHYISGDKPKYICYTEFVNYCPLLTLLWNGQASLPVHEMGYPVAQFTNWAKACTKLYFTSTCACDLIYDDKLVIKLNRKATNLSYLKTTNHIKLLFLKAIFA